MSLRESLSGFWQARSERERAVLGASVVFVAFALLYALVWEPGMAARHKLSAALPRMRAQVEDMRLQQREATALRKQIDAAPRRGDLGVLLQGAAAGAPFGRSVERLQSVAADRVLLQAGPVDFDAWLDWVAGVQRDFGARVDSCRIVALGQPGLVRVEATFVARPASNTGTAK